MERHVKERLVGAAVIVAIAVILIPELLSGPSSKDTPAVTPIRNEQGIKTYEFQLDGSGRATRTLKGSATAPPPEQPAAVEQPAEAPEISSEETATPLVAQKPVGAEPSPAPPTPSTTKPTPPSPAPAAQVPAPKSKPTRADGDTPGWAVQLGSFADEERATKLVARMAAAGHNAYIVPLRRPDGKVWQRVRIGPYPERAAAEAALARVGKEVKGAAVVTQP